MHPLYLIRVFIMEKKCKVEWCNNKWRVRSTGTITYSLWYCWMHYQRYKKYWDTTFTKVVLWNNMTKHKSYWSYKAMHERCRNTSWKYDRWWWRWIKVCDRWSWKYWFANFIEDMWEKPDWTSIDRINNDWNYEPSNCRRATAEVQLSNTSKNSNSIAWVSWYKRHNKWLVRATINGKRKSFWYFKDYNKAVAVKLSIKNAFLF